ncbi:unnamed protein product [Paramecium sonneborni]|uniref:Uncharacterized protein n=1 Tax=Paramecium sonneborni TaxID=65129 RepID=A0A8S1RSM9_9CILI|nr:unnamed protein product [Paramecium sonneborni]
MDDAKIIKRNVEILQMQFVEIALQQQIIQIVQTIQIHIQILDVQNAELEHINQHHKVLKRSIIKNIVNGIQNVQLIQRELEVNLEHVTIREMMQLHLQDVLVKKGSWLQCKFNK